jgi:glycosyltransferase involved in cell wall biosynthesis
MKDLVTLIATAGRPDLLARTLESLAACDRPRSYGGALVIENGPVNGAESIVRSFERRLSCRYLHVAEPNKSVALNAGLRLLDDCVVFFTDDDVRFDRGILTAYASAAAEGPGRFFGGPTGADYEVEPAEWLRDFLPVSARGWKLADGSAFDAKLSFLGFNWAAFAADIRRLGGFNPSRGPGSATGSTGQETEMQSRLRRGGIEPRYVPEAMVWHYIPAERCTPQWAADRAFRHGVQCGLESKKGVWSLLGAPPWVVARLVKGTIRQALAAVWRDPRYRMRARARQSYNRGLISGFRQQT